MNRSQLIKYTDIFSFLSLIGMMITGLVIEYSLPPRSGGFAVWGLTRHEWGDIHYFLSLLFLVLISTHLITHKRYIKQTILGQAGREKKYRVVIGMVGTAILILFLILLFTSPINNTNLAS